jgi:DNA invertase Pin-like site-specific DNA recombinase
VSELSRMGRSVGEIITTVDVLVKQQIRFIATKEGIDLDGKSDLQSKVMVTLFGLFAEIERELISMWTKEGLAAARASGKRLGRPKGKLGQAKLNGKEEEIQRLLSLQVSKSSIATITGVDRTALEEYLQGLQYAVKGLTQAEARWQPTLHTNHIAWLVWHAARAEDTWIARLRQSSQAWNAEGWADRFQMDPVSVGFGHTRATSSSC